MASRTERDIKRLISEAAKHRDELHAEYTRLETEIEQWQAKIDAFELTLTELGALAQDDEAVALPTKQIRNEMMRILREAGGPMHYGDIYDQLIARDVPVPGKDPRRNVGAHLSNDERFQSLGSGRWGLVSWRHDSAQTGPAQRNVVSLRDRVRGTSSHNVDAPGTAGQDDEVPSSAWADVPF